MSHITCPEGCTFTVPTHLAERALALHERTLHHRPEGCVAHEWRPRSVDEDESVCLKCGKIKMVLRTTSRLGWL